jgi:hypothetical protein
MKKRKYQEYIRDKYDQLSAQYLRELFVGKNNTLLKALNGVLTTLKKEKQGYTHDNSSKHDN